MPVCSVCSSNVTVLSALRRLSWRWCRWGFHALLRAVVKTHRSSRAFIWHARNRLSQSCSAFARAAFFAFAGLPCIRLRRISTFRGGRFSRTRNFCVACFSTSSHASCTTRLPARPPVRSAWVTLNLSKVGPEVLRRPRVRSPAHSSSCTPPWSYGSISSVWPAGFRRACSARSSCRLNGTVASRSSRLFWSGTTCLTVYLMTDCSDVSYTIVLHCSRQHSRQHCSSLGSRRQHLRTHSNILSFRPPFAVQQHV